MLPICATHCKWPLVRDSIPANLWYSGGLGLTGGLADIDSLFDCLIGIHEGKVQDSILDKYDQVRREMWYKFIDPVSSDNLRRLNGQDPEKALEQDKLLRALELAARNVELAREMQLVSITLCFLNSVLIVAEWERYPP
jgi:2-polyprenyl-6-methoxyphenol hydroxylase-like FAD-dependent oxidoreductase